MNQKKLFLSCYYTLRKSMTQISGRTIPHFGVKNDNIILHYFIQSLFENLHVLTFKSLHYSLDAITFSKANRDLPNSRSLSSRLASRLSLRSCRSISALIRFCSFCSSDRQHAILDTKMGLTALKSSLSLIQSTSKSSSSRLIKRLPAKKGLNLTKGQAKGASARRAASGHGPGIGVTASSHFGCQKRLTTKFTIRRAFSLQAAMMLI